eukprot:c13759_g1_i3.p1 GENE.c13759_g1_i3~~c13759_g1_i3.p1  ORF type:complete len:297 (-),score=40.46 c13759_g1_i3:97-960(-)
MSEACVACKSLTLVDDYETGDTVCISCGVVSSARIVCQDDFPLDHTTEAEKKCVADIMSPWAEFFKSTEMRSFTEEEDVLGRAILALSESSSQSAILSEFLATAVCVRAHEVLRTIKKNEKPQAGSALLATAVIIACKLECVPCNPKTVCGMFHPRADLKTTSQLVVKTCQTLGLTKKPLARQTPVSKLIRKGLDKLGISDSIIQVRFCARCHVKFILDCRMSVRKLLAPCKRVNPTAKFPRLSVQVCSLSCTSHRTLHASTFVLRFTRFRKRVETRPFRSPTFSTF